MGDPNPVFDLLDPTDRDPERTRLLGARTIPATLGNLHASAALYQPSDDLVDAINVALAVGAPLLLTGEPGTGKTQVGHYLAWYFGLEERFYPLYVRSTTTAEDLLYRFDAVAYLQAAHDAKQRGRTLRRERFVEKGPLWRAYEADGPAVVLIDEVDKAPRDFPNDLLNVLQQHEFFVPEARVWVSRGDRPPPVVVITSNSERRLPEPFLRRCVFHHILFDEALLDRAVRARADAGDFDRLDPAVQDLAIERFLEIRAKPIRKKPATAELLVWLAVLAARDDIGLDQLRGPLRRLPAISTLIKDRDDLDILG